MTYIILTILALAVGAFFGWVLDRLMELFCEQ